MANYNILLQTGDVSGGGTDFNIFAKIECENGWSPADLTVDSWWNLDNDGDDNERGDRDQYLIGGSYVGAPVKLHLLCFEHNGQRNPSNDWFLDNVEVIDLQTRHGRNAVHANWVRSPNGYTAVRLSLSAKEAKSVNLPPEIRKLFDEGERVKE